jgi:hypothetical protein
MAGGLPIPANHSESSTALRKLVSPAAAGLSYYCVNEVPQPQLRVACGFWNTKPRRIKSS